MKKIIVEKNQFCFLLNTLIFPKAKFLLKREPSELETEKIYPVASIKNILEINYIQMFLEHITDNFSHKNNFFRMGYITNYINSNLMLNDIHKTYNNVIIINNDSVNYIVGFFADKNPEKIGLKEFKL